MGPASGGTFPHPAVGGAFVEPGSPGRRVARRSRRRGDARRTRAGRRRGPCRGGDPRPDHGPLERLPGVPPSRRLARGGRGRQAGGVRLRALLGQACLRAAETPPRVLVVGLAPAAHGANRTGRVFTGDRSRRLAVRRAVPGRSRLPTDVDRSGDGLRLTGARVVAAVRCAPPANKPTPAERDTCAPWLDRELELVRPTLARRARARGVRVATRSLGALARAGVDVPRPRPRFGSRCGAAARRAVGGLLLVGAITRASRTRSPVGSRSRCSTRSSRVRRRREPQPTDQRSPNSRCAAVGSPSSMPSVASFVRAISSSSAARERVEPRRQLAAARAGARRAPARRTTGP